VVVSEVISRAYVGYFPLMASQPLVEAEAYENNRRHENNFYCRGVDEQSKRKIYIRDWCLAAVFGFVENY